MFLVLFTGDRPLFSRAYIQKGEKDQKKTTGQRTVCYPRNGLLYVTCDFGEK